MGRPARYIPENKDGVLVEVTGRAIGGMALLCPGPNPFKFNELVAGIMGRALEVSPLDLCSAVVVSNHLHLLCVVHEQQALSRFMAHFACNLSKEIDRFRGWRGPMWERRYDAIVVGRDAEFARLKYSLSHGPKEELVESPLRWPGIHAARHLVHGEPLEGCWCRRAARSTRYSPSGSRSGPLDVPSTSLSSRQQQVERVGRRKPWPDLRHLRFRHPVLDKVRAAASLPPSLN